MLPILFALSIARPDILIADFEQPTYGDWTTSGTAFGTGPAQGTLPNQMSVSGYKGHGLVNTYLNDDRAIGTLTSPPFTIQRKYLNFLIGGGYHPGKTGMSLFIDGKPVLLATGNSRTPQDSEALTWSHWDVAKWQGKSATIEIFDLETGGWGHINVDEIAQSDKPMETVKPKPEPLYKETYRPQFHFSAKKDWLNDPNGLVFADGEYHLFFQYSPGEIHGGTKYWGHAVSRDLFHWQELPIALSPDKFGANWSGSADIDHANTTGFGINGKPPMVAMFTAAGNPFTQCLAYSNDKGRTWSHYINNPVLGNVRGENRDPRIFWHAPTHEWKMVIYVDGDEFGLYGSPNLKEWHELSRLHLPGSAECPELFEMPVQGSKESKWVFYAANCRYLVGSFDGKTFHPETEPRMLDFGQFYASQTFNNVANGRRIQIGWLNGPGPYPNTPFNQQMSVPCDLKLIKGGDGYTILRQPSIEIEALHKLKIVAVPQTVTEANTLLAKLKGGIYDLAFAFQLVHDTPIHISIGGQDLVVSPADKSVSFLGKSAPFSNTNGKVRLRILVDRSSVEIFLMHGETSLTAYLPTSNILPKNRKISVKFLDKDAKFELLRADEMKSTW